MTISVKTGRSNITVEVPDGFSLEHAERWVDLAIDYVKEIDKQSSQPIPVQYRSTPDVIGHNVFQQPQVSQQQQVIPLSFT